VPTSEEIGFILRNANRYLEHDPNESDILSCFAGMRPLVSKGGNADSKSISRKHEVLVSASGLITLAGGKWTTYRQMAEDTIDGAIDIGTLPANACVTHGLNLHGWMQRDDPELPSEDHLHFYGSDARRITDLVRHDPALGEKIHDELPYTLAQVVWAAREELACTVEDVLSRRTRALLLHARASVEAAPTVASLLADELGHDAAWEVDQVARYADLAKTYLPSGVA
jgi:glycerol-3-phosphate dehydrogenase